MSDTTAMIDVTATMLPSTVISERSLAAQIALSAMPAASRYLFTMAYGVSRSLAFERLHPHRIAVGHAAHVVVRTGDHLIAGLDARQHLEVAIAGDADLDRHELGASVADDEDAFGLLARLPGSSSRGRRRPTGCASAAADSRLRRLSRSAPSRRRSSSRTATAGIGTATTFLRVAVVMSAVRREPGPHVGHLFVEHDDDLEVGRLLIGRAWPVV